MKNFIYIAMAIAAPIVLVNCTYNPQNEMYQKLKRNVHFLSGG